MEKTIHFSIITHEQKAKIQSFIHVSAPSGGGSIFAQGLGIPNTKIALEILAKLEALMAEIEQMCEPEDKKPSPQSCEHK